MPTKLNKAGNQQNYVPSGHGDASGEYGDNDTGSNIHIQFKKFEKPKDGQKSVNKNPDNVDIKDKLIEEGNLQQAKQNNYKYVIDNGSFDNETIKGLKDIINNADDECIELLNKAYQKDNYTIAQAEDSVFYINNKLLACGKDNILQESDIRVRGGTWFHENGHLLNWQGRNIYSQPFSSTYKSKNTGLTLNETLKKELTELAKTNDFYFEIIGKEAELEEKYVNTYKDIEEYRKFENLINNVKQKYKQIQMDYSKKVYNGELPREELLNKMNEINRINMEEEALGNNLNKYIKMNNEVKILKEKGTREFKKLYSAISDAYSSIESYGFGVGHSKSYYQKDDFLLGDEFFANCFSNKTVKSNKAIEVTKKYFPKSYEVFEEMLKEAFK